MTKRKLTKLEALQLALRCRDLGQALRLLEGFVDYRPMIEWLGTDYGWSAGIADVAYVGLENVEALGSVDATTPLGAFRKAVRALIKVEKGQSQ